MISLEAPAGTAEVTVPNAPVDEAACQKPTDVICRGAPVYGTSHSPALPGCIA